MDVEPAVAVATLGDFLRARRTTLRPEEVGLPEYGRRRVAGLRREELAQLAGVSVDYYTRIEQNRVQRPSDEVLDGLTRALRLSGDEIEYLYRLARPRGDSRGRSARSRVRPVLQLMLDALTDLPALVMGRRMEVLAWNRAATALFGDFAAQRPADRNVARSTFLDPATRSLYADWAGCARENVAYLRFQTGRHPDDRELAALVGELAVKSEEFRRWWAEHPVRDKTSGRKGFRHPVIGDFTLSYDTLRAADDPDQALVTYAALPGSPDEDALRMLLSWTAVHNPPAPTPTAKT